MTANDGRASKYLILLRLIAAGGAVTAGFLWWVRTNHAIHPGCLGSGDCSYVWFSRWALWFGLPVSALALAPYTAVLGATWLQRRPNWTGSARNAIAGLAVFLILMALWFVALQGLVIRQWCRWCLVSHAFAVGTALVSLVWLKSSSPGTSPEWVWLRPKACLAGVIAAFIAIAGHSFSARQPDESVFRAMPNMTALQRDSAVTLRVFDRPLNILTETLPYHTSEKAPEVIVTLFDYTCPDCRRLHGQMRHAMAAFPGRFQELLLPAPLSRKCNPAVSEDTELHAEACQLARIACVVGKFRPEAFPLFHDWLMSGDQPPSATAALEKARSLLPPAVDITQECENPANLRPLAAGVRAFQDNKQVHQMEGVPLCLTESGSFMGVPEEIGTLVKFFGE